jgi:hypothetical protein
VHNTPFSQLHFMTLPSKTRKQKQHGGSSWEQELNLEAFALLTVNLCGAPGKQPRKREDFEKAAGEALVLIEACRSVLSAHEKKKPIFQALERYKDNTLVPFEEAVSQITGKAYNSRILALFVGCLEKINPRSLEPRRLPDGAEEVSELKKWKKTGIEVSAITHLKRQFPHWEKSPAAKAINKKWNAKKGE